MKKYYIKNILLISCFFATPFYIYSQESDITRLLEGALKEQGLGGSLGGTNLNTQAIDRYQSSSLNEYSNIVSQLSKLDEESRKENLEDKLLENKIDLATKLCIEDEAACFLIDNYRNTKKALNEKPISPDNLKLFGIDVFSGYPLSFDQSSITAINPNYLLKSGDIIEVSILGTQSIQNQIKINQDGELLLPLYGPISLAGLTLDEARSKASKFVSSKNFADEIFLSILISRPLQVYVMGQVAKPGRYLIGSGDNVINGIVAAGGFRERASLRTIKVMRGGELIHVIDLYDFLVDGIIDDSFQLIDGDTVLVGAVGSSIKIYGDINIQAEFEILEDSNYSDVLAYAGGYRNKFNRETVNINRRLNSGDYQIFEYSASQPILMNDGDLIFIPPVYMNEVSNIAIFGATKAKGFYEFKQGTSLGDYINIEKDLLNDTYAGLVLIKRFDSTTKNFKFLFEDLFSQERLNSFKLQVRDIVFVLGWEDISFLNSKSILQAINKSENVLNENSCVSEVMSFGGPTYLESISIKLSLARDLSEKSCTELFTIFPEILPIALFKAVPVVGNIRNPGVYPITKAVNINQLISLSGDIAERDLFNGNIDIATSDYRIKTINKVGIESLLESDIKFLNIKTNYDAANRGYVNLVGEFNSPGIYPIDENTTLTEIYKRAGGLTQQSYPMGAILTRESIKKLEQDALIRSERELAKLMTSAITSGLIKQSGEEAIGILTLLNSLSNAEPVGRLITELDPNKLARDPSKDIYLRSNDTIYMPKLQNVVTVVGSVRNAVTVPYNSKLNIDDYIKMAGGMDQSGDASKIFVLLPNGSSTTGRSSFFGYGDPNIFPGSTIIVPRKSRPLEGLSFVEAISPILANLSISLASINSITNN